QRSEGQAGLDGRGLPPGLRTRLREADQRPGGGNGPLARGQGADQAERGAHATPGGDRGQVAATAATLATRGSRSQSTAERALLPSLFAPHGPGPRVGPRAQGRFRVAEPRAREALLSLPP